MKEKLLVILRLCLQIAITWEVFWGKNLNAQFHWGSSESQKVGEDIGILIVSLGFTRAVTFDDVCQASQTAGCTSDHL